MNVEMTMSVSYTRMQCSECGIIYFFPDKWCATALEKGIDWRCPNGHRQWYGESEFEKVTRQRDRAVQEQARLAEEARLADARAIAAKRKLKRMETRISAGTCPCCNRNFANVARHMRTKHPDIVPLRRPA